MNITFMTTLGQNVGDEFIRAGLRAVLDAAGVSYRPFYVCKHNLETLTKSVEDEIAMLADKYWNTDVFIQAGAPVYWNNAESKSTTSVWHDELWEKRILNPEGKHPMFLNLGAGSCLAWGQEEDVFLQDEACRDFAKRAGKRAALTVTRDWVATEIALDSCQPQPLPCPAFLVAEGWRPLRTQRGLIGVNLMALGCHHDLDGKFEKEYWQRWIPRFLERLRREGRLVFIAHDEAELEFMSKYATAEERVFVANNWRAYVDLYGVCDKVIANRVHGATLAAGFGIPSVILGNDTRAYIGNYIGIPVLQAGVASCSEILTALKSVSCVGLVEKRKEAFREYIKLILGTIL